jgi:hypothetical protein
MRKELSPKELPSSAPPVEPHRERSVNLPRDSLAARHIETAD